MGKKSRKMALNEGGAFSGKGCHRGPPEAAESHREREASGTRVATGREGPFYTRVATEREGRCGQGLPSRATESHRLPSGEP